MVANCANESIIHVKVDVKQAYVAVLEQMNASVRNAKLLLNTPFETLAKSLELQRIGKRRLALPIFFSLYDLLREGTLRFDDVIVERIPDSHVNPFQEIGIQAVVEPGTLRFAVDFDETLFAKQRIEALLDTLILMLEKVLEDPETIVADLPFDSSLAQGVEEDAVLAPSESIEHVEPQTLVETRLAEIWTELLDVHPIGRFDDFWDLGGSSLLAIRLIDRVHEVFGAQLGIDALMSGPSLREVASRIERSGKRRKIDRSVWISSDRDQPKLFCIPGIGGLAAFTFRNIGSFLEGSVSLVGLQMRGLDGLEEPDDRIEKMASTMLDEMRAIQPEGPYHLCGNSFGGSIAMEVARLIQVSGDEIPSLLLLDTYPPNFIRLHRRLLRTFKKRISGDGRSEGAPERDEFDPIMPEAALAKIGGLVNAIENSLATTKAASWMYTPDRYVGNMDLVLSTSRVDAKSINENRFVIEWGKHVDGKLTLHPILVQHLQLVRDGSEEISEVIRSIVLDDDGGTR